MLIIKAGQCPRPPTHLYGRVPVSFAPTSRASFAWKKQRERRSLTRTPASEPGKRLYSSRNWNRSVRMPAFQRKDSPCSRLLCAWHHTARRPGAPPGGKTARPLAQTKKPWLSNTSVDRHRSQLRVDAANQFHSSPGSGNARFRSAARAEAASASSWRPTSRSPDSSAPRNSSKSGLSSTGCSSVGS